ncbi:hypothetical protein [Pacificoceanicola onchidii]|uniref:hypothetical protein n=1 Tax=Pacificoceanicola onchidii TaxID=2562685 RepID=UPI0010A67E35|nr:hypothetical protein [Pacificoceanicola onchidii]
MAKAKSKKPIDKEEVQAEAPEAKVEENSEATSEATEADTPENETPEAPADLPEEVSSEDDQTDPLPEDETIGEDAPEDGTAEGDVEDVSDKAEDQDTEVSDLEEAEDLSADVEPLEEPEPADVAPAEGEPTPAPVVQEKIIERKGGFVPTVLGGVVAAALGFGAAEMDLLTGSDANPFEEEARTTIAAQSEQIADLQAKLEEAQKAIAIVDLQPLTNSLAGVEDSVSGIGETVTTLEGTFAQFDSRMTALEKAPVAGAVGPEAIAAYERELQELRLAISAQKQAVEEQKAEIQAMAEEALAANANAEDQATLASSRGAAAEVIALVQEGKAFSQPLALLGENGVSVPQELSDFAGDGVATLTTLVTEFPDAARAALTVARRSNAGEGGGGIGNFLSNQLGARSVAPREGDDPDAVLSRAEAAVKSGNLDAALSEISALPEAAQAELADWAAQAEARRAVLAAAQSLAQDLNNQ